MRVPGKNGRLYVGVGSSTDAASPLVFCRKWQFSITSDKVDITARGDSNRVALAKKPSITGTFDGFFDTATAQTYTASQDGLSRRFYLYPSTPASTLGSYYFGTATFDFGAEGQVDDAVNCKGDWEADTFWIPSFSAGGDGFDSGFDSGFG